MPNWKLGSHILTHLNDRARDLARRQADYAADRCPLDHDTLQRMLVPDANVWQHLTAARDAGVDVPTVKSVSIVFSAKAWQGFIPRTAMFSIKPVKGSFWWTPKSYGYDVMGPAHDGRSASPHDWKRKHGSVYPRPEGFDDDTRQQIAGWANQAVKMARLRWIAMKAVNNALVRLDSTGRVIATWPFLASLCTDSLWTGRFRAPPARLAPYVDQKIDDYVPKVHRDATEVLLTGAQMMEPWKADDSRIWAQLLCYNETADPGDYAP